MEVWDLLALMEVMGQLLQLEFHVVEVEENGLSQLVIIQEVVVKQVLIILSLVLIHISQDKHI